MPSPSVEEQVAASRARLAAGDVEAALAGLESAFVAAREQCRWSAAAWAANWLGHVHEHTVGDLLAALGWFATAARTADMSPARLPRTRAAAAFNAGVVEDRRGRTTAATSHYRRAQQWAASAGDGALEAGCGQRLGAALAELGRFSEARVELERAATVAESAGRAELARRCRAEAARAGDAGRAEPPAQFELLAAAAIDRCLASVGQAAPSQVLDAGTGWGGGLLRMAERWPGARLTGIDRAETTPSIRVPRSLRSRVELRRADLSEGLTGLSGFDVVVCHAVLHTADDTAALLATLAAALRPGGDLVGACFTDAYCAAIRTRLAAAGQELPWLSPPLTAAAVDASLVTAGFEGVETWAEAVELQVDEAVAGAHLERLLGRPVGAVDARRLLDATGRPLRLDLCPLSFRAVARAKEA